MRIGNRVFPYPILNNFKYVSDFKSSSNYELVNSFTENSDVYRKNDCILFKDIYFRLEDEDLLKLYAEGKLKSCLIVESSASVYRKMFELGLEPRTISIPIHLLKDDVYVSSYIYANEDINDYFSKGFDEDYNEYIIKVKKHSIIAVDDGFKFRVSTNDMQDDKVSSIFMIIRRDANNDIMEYENTSDKIKIYLPEKHFKNYESLKMQSMYNNEFFAMLIIPVLTSCIFEIQSEAKEDGNIEVIADILVNKKWFSSICTAYEREMKEKLTLEILMDFQPLKIAQIVLNSACLKGMENFSVLLLSGDRGSADE